MKLNKQYFAIVDQNEVIVWGNCGFRIFAEESAAEKELAEWGKGYKIVPITITKSWWNCLWNSIKM